MIIIDKLILRTHNYVTDKHCTSITKCSGCMLRHHNLCVVLDKQFRRIILKKIRKINKNAKE